LRSIRANFLYYLTIAVAVFGIAALCIPFFSSLAPAADNSAPVIEFDLTLFTYVTEALKILKRFTLRMIARDIRNVILTDCLDIKAIKTPNTLF